eukprot:1588213-Pleurochrysis_carterae.AAC.1
MSACARVYRTHLLPNVHVSASVGQVAASKLKRAQNAVGEEDKAAAALCNGLKNAFPVHLELVGIR